MGITGTICGAREGAVSSAMQEPPGIVRPTIEFS
jgi:hypothetical protein